VFLKNGKAWAQGTYDEMLNTQDDEVKHFFKK